MRSTPGRVCSNGQAVGLLLQAIQQASIEAGDAGLDLLDVAHQFIEDEAMAGGQVPLQGIEEFLAAGLQPAAGQREDLVGGCPGDEGFDHGTGRLAMDIADHHAQADPAVGQHLVQPILLRGS